MKFLNLLVVALSVTFLFNACQSEQQGFITKKATEDDYTYEYVTNDPSKTRIYTLDNGLKVYLSAYKEKPRIQTYIPVKAGGKFDPANSTGLAHYLEHMMFKGTSTFCTKDWDSEKILLDSIEQMYQHYRTLTGAKERKAQYAKIDEISNRAAKFAIANEYDKMMAFIGATGTNAYTTEDRTVYVNNIPSNQLNNWLKIEGNRFEMIVNRLFHTELEAVYEEKNRSLDNDYWKAFEAMYKLLFKKHLYGTQTVIGTIEHLKNPSITDIKAYFDKYYVPNNMAVCLSGDLDPRETIKLIDQYFGKLPAKPLEAFQPPIEDTLTSVREKTVWGPDKERVTIGFRLGGTSSPDQTKVELVDMLLNNSTAGLIDLNLVQNQKVLQAGSYVDNLNDYSIHTFYGEPREGQSLEEVRDLILEQIEAIKKGEFENWLVEAVINDFKKGKMRALENNYARANDMVMSFTNDMPWKDYIGKIQKMEHLSKEDIVSFANKIYGNGYAVVYKKNGKDPNKLHVEKPAITKVPLDRSSVSEFFKGIQETAVPSIEPVFVDYKKDMTIGKMKSDVPVLYKQNEENALFSLYYLLETGTNENTMVELAMNYLKYLGTEKLSNEAFKKELYKLGCDFDVNASEERIYVTLTGLDENMVPAMQLFEELLANPQGNEERLVNMVSDTHKKRADAKKSKSAILWGGLANYAKYGKASPFTNVLSNEELNNLHSQELIEIIRSVLQMKHKVLYYGPRSMADLIKVLDENHRVPDQLRPLPERRKFAELENEDPKVFFSNYDMVQAEMVLQNRGPKFNPEIAPEVAMFNEYFGGGMSGVVFQEIREAQGLAYSVFSSYRQGDKVDENDNLMAYIGTQADKQEEALDALVGLLNNLPKSEKNFETSKKAILNKIESTRITKSRVLFNYLSAQERNLDYDLRRDIYAGVKKMSFEDLTKFHQKYVKDKNYNLAVVGSEDKMNFIALGKYGKVVKLSLEEVFGYGDNKVKLED